VTPSTLRTLTELVGGYCRTGVESGRVLGTFFALSYVWGCVSHSLAIASVTAVLRHTLENGLVAQGVTASLGGDASVSALPPDRITVGADEKTQLNLFLFQVSPNTGLRRPVGLPSSKTTLSARPVLSLDLHYILTAYGASEYQSEILLGHAVKSLQNVSTLGRDQIRTALASLTSTVGGRMVPAPLAALAASKLAEQVEDIKIESQFLSLEDMSRIWSALQARFRPSVVYKVSLVSLE